MEWADAYGGWIPSTPTANNNNNPSTNPPAPSLTPHHHHQQHSSNQPPPHPLPLITTLTNNPSNYPPPHARPQACHGANPLYGRVVRLAQIWAGNHLLHPAGHLPLEVVELLVAWLFDARAHPFEVRAGGVCLYVWLCVCVWVCGCFG